MPKVMYIASNGESRVVEVPEGTSAMEGALQNLVPGIDGDCGGACACGTCHVHVDSAWMDKVGPATSEMELQMLELTDACTPYSRLACQITLTSELDGLILNMPKAQH